MTLRAALAAAFLLALAACGRDEPVADPAAGTDIDESPAAPVSEVGAFDEIGTVSAPVAGLAIWSHPTLPYRGAIAVAAAGEGLELRDFDGSRLDQRIGGYTTGLDLVYLGRGREARAILVGLDRVDSAFVLHRITTLPVAFKNIEGRFSAGAVSGFCLDTDHESDAFSLYVLDGSTRVRERRFSVDASDVARETPGSEFAGPAPLERCVVDRRDHALLALDTDGGVWRAKLTDGTPNFEKLIDPTGPAVDLSVILQSNAGSDPSIRRGQIVLTRPDAAAVDVHDLKTGARLGAVALIRYDGVPGVEKPGAARVASGNFGGVYRAGVLVVAESAAEPAVRLSPWTAVANEVGFPLFDTIDPRWPAPVEPDPAVSLAPLPSLERDQ